MVRIHFKETIMNKKWYLLILIITFSQPAAVAAKLNVFACEPEWAALAKELGGNQLRIYSATTGLQDPHHIQARPSLLAKARRADLLICTGAELEIGWLPILLRRTGNRKIQAGQLGHFMASDYVKMLEIPTVVDRSLGDIHASGNPHIQTDPSNIAAVASVLAQRLIQIDSRRANYYQSRYQNFSKRWQQAMQRWKKEAAILKGTSIVVHHKSWVYMENWLSLQEVATLEPKPGLPPTSWHLAQVLRTLKQNPAKMVIYASYQNSRPANWLARRANIPAVALPITVGGNRAAKDLFSLFDNIISLLKGAIK